jgi:hypothetical protein
MTDHAHDLPAFPAMSTNAEYLDENQAVEDVESVDSGSTGC